jgi:hypothetical protein
MAHCTCGSSARWCARADALLDVPRMHVLEVARDDRGRSAADGEDRPGCDGLPVVRGCRDGPRPSAHRVHDAPCFATSAVLLWRKRWTTAEGASASVPTGGLGVRSGESL